MKNPLLTIFFLFVTHTLFASSLIDLGLSVGSSEPLDSKMLETFRRDFYIQGQLGIRDPHSGFALRGNLGHYSSPSVHQDDIGKDTTISVTPLTASLLYHITPESSVIQPYIGGGIGAYFYGLKDNTYRSLDSGTRFGTHLLAGIKLNLSPNFYVGAEYTRSFANPIIFNKSSNFDQSMLTFGIGILSGTDAKTPQNKVNRKEYESLLLSQINDLTIEVQKIKENRTKVELRITTFYENTAANEYIGLFEILDEAITGQKVIITHPRTNTTLAEGTLSSIEQSSAEIRFVLQDNRGWQLPVVVQTTPMHLRIGTTDYPKLSPREIKTAIQVESIRDDHEFAQELRRIQYLESQLKRIDKSLAEAEAQLKTYHQQWKDIQPKEDTVIRVEERYSYPVTPTYYHYDRRSTPYAYRYYHAQDYVAPIYVPSTPPSAEEKAQFIEAKKERIQSIRNR
jgi:hypothetical protein